MLKKIEIMIMIMKSYNVLQKRSVSKKYKKCSSGKYTLLLYVAVSIRWISTRFDFGIYNLKLLIGVINEQICQGCQISISSFFLD